MLANHRRIGYLFILAFIVGAFLPVATPQTVQAQDVEYGYYWRLDFDFDSSYDALLTIEVGPWENGQMTEVTETSESTVTCKRNGNVKLESGHAVFANGGYLRCYMDLAQIVWDNHQLEIPAVDTYGSIYASADVLSDAANVAPIFVHSDAKYSIDFTNSSSVKPIQALSNGVGPQAKEYVGVGGNAWHNYEMFYNCVPGGICEAAFWVDGAFESVPTAGHRANFNTAPAGFLIGSDGITTFSGRIDNLVIDPGNTAH